MAPPPPLDDLAASAMLWAAEIAPTQAEVIAYLLGFVTPVLAAFAAAAWIISRMHRPRRPW